MKLQLTFVVLALALFCVAMAQEKTEWPEVVGKTAEEAKEQILKDKPDATVVVLPEGSPVTKDYNPDRVRVFVDTQNVVVSTPRIG